MPPIAIAACFLFNKRIVPQDDYFRLRIIAFENIHSDNSLQKEGYWSDAVMSSPTPPPVPKHRHQVESEELCASITNELG
ncbi:unnamed protein product [Anisakis simplex]|uniref:Cyclin N-terminal domain-containing protein n=1 Tax=Anisakis simplex TaxID=6269 RepID=A0A0M3J950_ANISI|nr:unnamed protein product [Anisakis simplex]